jgi:hypothetical protein
MPTKTRTLTDAQLTRWLAALGAVGGLDVA